MADTYLIQKATLDDIGDAIRAKTGGSALIPPTSMPAAIGDITAGDQIAHSSIPAYVKEEVRGVLDRVQERLQTDSIVFLAGSDSHESSTAHVADGNLHGGMAMKALAYALPLDFACYLGDYTAGSQTTTLAEGRAHIAQINADINEAFAGLPNFRTTGNHDPLGYSYSQNHEVLSQTELYSVIERYNADSGATMGSATVGYCYRDFAAKHVRVICLNTADNPAPTASAEAVSAAQKQWFADTLISTPTGYGIIVLSHHPLDWGDIMSVSHILHAYVEEQSSINIGGVTYSFTGKNKSAWQLAFHGHVHCFKTDWLHWNNGGTGVAYDVKRIAVPNMCFVRNNEYGSNTGPEYYGIEFGESQTYNKTADSGKDTALCVMVVNPSEQKVYAICYGAGYDREVYWGAQSIPVSGISIVPASGTMYIGGSVQLSPVITPSDATNKTVTWTSSNDQIATVSNGLVSAVSICTAVITARTQDGGYTATYYVTVEAVPQGNLINEIGYTDGKRISTGDGTYRDQPGGVVIEYIDLSVYRTASNTVTIRIKGADFEQRNNPYNNNAYVFYNASKAFTVASYLTPGTGSHGGITLVRSFTSDDGGTMTLEISGLSASAASGGYHYLRLCGLGSGANIDLRINEDFS